jgi:uncharacterized protein (DUF1697 family)
MTHYVAMMRGFGPGDPNMRHDRLRPLFEGLGFTDVQPVISSGNVVFQSDATDTARLESIIETALEQHLGFFRAAVVLPASSPRPAPIGMSPFSNRSRKYT